MNWTNGCWKPSDLHPYLHEKFWLVGVVGTVIPLVGIAGNLFLLAILIRKSLRGTYLDYLSVLAVLDIGILVCHIAAFPVKIFSLYFQLEFLYRIWVYCAAYIIFTAKLVLIASTYLLIAATAERYAEVRSMCRNQQLYVSSRQRFLVTFIVLLFAVVFGFPALWQLRVEVKHVKVGPNCTLSEFQRLDVVQTELMTSKNGIYKELYVIWLDSFIRQFLPFLFLITLNVLIISHWRKLLGPPLGMNDLLRATLLSENLSIILDEHFLKYDARLSPVRHKDTVKNREIRRRGLKVATKMMLAIVTSYLLANLLRTVVLFWEFVDMDFLQRHKAFYTFAVDISSLLLITNCSIRLPIYYATNPKVKHEILGALGRRSVENARISQKRLEVEKYNLLAHSASKQTEPLNNNDRCMHLIVTATNNGGSQTNGEVPADKSESESVEFIV